MKYTKLNNNWNADPNIPEPQIRIEDDQLYLEFFLNYFIHKNVKKGQKGRLTFKNCYMYRLGSPNDHGFFLKQFRYGPDDLKWGEFYELTESDWKSDFPDDKVMVNDNLKDDKELKHYLFFFRENTFECLAKEFKFEILEQV